MARYRFPLLAIVYVVLAGVGLVGTWTFNLAYFGTPTQGGAPSLANYLGDWFANDASSSAALDLLVIAVAACLVMLVEGARLGWSRWVWIFVPLSFAVAVSFTFPLFLGLRELALRRRSRSGQAGEVVTGAVSPRGSAPPPPR